MRRDLPAAGDLAHGGVADERLRLLGNVRLHGQARVRRRLDGRDIADAGKGHVERTGDGRRRHGEAVHVPLVIFDLFLVLDAEPLLLVEDEKPEIAELHVGGKQPVGPDDEVDLPLCERGKYFCLFGRRLKAVENGDAHAEFLHAGLRRLKMLLA